MAGSSSFAARTCVPSCGTSGSTGRTSSLARMSPALCPLGHLRMPGRTSAVTFASFVGVHVGAEQDRLGVHHLDDEHLVVVAIVGGDARQPARFVPSSHLSGKPRVIALKGQHLIRIEPHGLLQFGQLPGVGELGRQRQERELVALGVPVAVVDLHSRQAVDGVVLPLLDVREEDQPVAGRDRCRRSRRPSGPSAGGSTRGVHQEAAGLRAGNEQHAVLQSPPAAVDEVARRAVVIGEQERMDARLLRVGQHLGSVPPVCVESSAWAWRMQR